MFRFRRHLFGSVPLLAVAAALACGGESLVVPPTTGTVGVTTATIGAEPDADGYLVQLDGGAEQSVGASAGLQIEGVTPGTHAVQLAGVAANCTVGGENPRTVSITAGETATAAFEVTCSATTGSLQVSSSTGGPSTDPDGYGVNVDGTDRGFLTPTGDLTIDGLPAGDHLIGLSGVSGNCQVQGDNPRTATIIAGASTTTAFAITCTPPPANAGSLRITTATTGADVDADGYTFAVDGGSRQTIEINASAPSVTNISAGQHTVLLSGVAANCTIADGVTRTVTVTAGGTTEVTFAVTCAATTGSVRVSTLTTGANRDGAYSVTVEGAPSKAITDAAPVTVSGLLAGPHDVTLTPTSIAGNCEVEGNNPRSINVTVAATVEVVLAVACTAPATGPGVWTLKAQIPTVREGLAAAVVQNASSQYILYAIGGTAGIDPLDRVEAYNATTDTWSPVAPLPSPRAWIKASAIDGNIYVPGGYDASSIPTATLYVYSPSTNGWTTKKEMPVASAFNLTDAYGGKLYVLTGQCESCGGAQRLYRYDPVTDAWSNLADPIRDHSKGAMAVIDGKLYAAWGNTSSLDVYDIATNSWTHKLDMTEFGSPDAFGGLFASASSNLNKKFWVIGGLSDDNAQNVTLAYDPVTNTWDFNKAPMRVAREHPAAGKVKDATGVIQILTVGGLDTDLVKDSELYKP
ncbi:MAG: kelch repeat-containing protein [Gemmatimonadales bacterium]